jgi:hypothetical protein
MTEIRIVEVYGIKVDARVAALLEIVLDFGGSEYSHKQQQADAALEKLGRLGAAGALQCIVKKFSASDYSHRRQLATRALVLI